MKYSTTITISTFACMVLVGSCARAQTIIAAVAKWQKTGTGYVQRMNSRLYKLDASSGSMMALADDHADDEYPVVSHNKRLCLYEQNEDSLCMLDLKSRRHRLIYGFASGNDELIDYRWSPDDRYIAIVHLAAEPGSRADSVLIVNRSGQKVDAIESALNIMWSDDSDRIFYADENYTLHVHQLSKGSTRTLAQNFCPVIPISHSKILVFSKSDKLDTATVAVLDLNTLRLSPAVTIPDILFRYQAYRVYSSLLAKGIYVICCIIDCSDGLHGSTLLINLNNGTHYDFVDESDVDYKLVGAVSSHQFILLSDRWVGGYKRTGYRKGSLLLVDYRRLEQRKRLFSGGTVEIDGATSFTDHGYSGS